MSQESTPTHEETSPTKEQTENRADVQEANEPVEVIPQAGAGFHCFPPSWSVAHVFCLHLRPSNDLAYSRKFSWPHQLRSKEKAHNTLLMHTLAAILTFRVLTPEREFGAAAADAEGGARRAPALSFVLEPVTAVDPSSDPMYEVLCWRLWLIVHDAKLDLRAEHRGLMDTLNAEHRQRLKRVLGTMEKGGRSRSAPVDPLGPHNYRALTTPEAWTARVAKPMMAANAESNAWFLQLLNSHPNAADVPLAARITSLLLPTLAFHLVPRSPDEWKWMFGLQDSTAVRRGARAEQMRLASYLSNGGKSFTIPDGIMATWFPATSFTFQGLFPELNQ